MKVFPLEFVYIWENLYFC